MGSYVRAQFDSVALFRATKFNPGHKLLCACVHFCKESLVCLLVSSRDLYNLCLFQTFFFLFATVHLFRSPVWRVAKTATKLEPIYGDSDGFKARDIHKWFGIAGYCVAALDLLGGLLSMHRSGLTLLIF